MAPASSSPVAPVSDSQTKLTVAEARLSGGGAAPREPDETALVPAPAESGETLGEARDERDEIEDSDVFVYRRAGEPVTKREVTLFVHGWENVEPGLLSWTFPSLRAALDAVQRMKNAVGWCIVEGTGWVDLDSARAHGAILVEQV